MSDASHIHDEISLLERSMDDARIEFERGELDEARFTQLWERDQAAIVRLREKLRGVDASTSSEEPQAPTEEHRDYEGVAGRSLSRGLVLSLLAAAVIVVALAIWLSVGSGTSSSSQRDTIISLLNRADAEVQNNKPAEALVLYNEVLKMDPTQSQALAESGWLTFEAGMVAGSKPLIAHGESLVREASSVDPGLYAAHLYLGVIELLANRNPKAAMAQFNLFESLHPPAKWLALANPYISQASKDLIK